MNCVFWIFDSEGQWQSIIPHLPEGGVLVIPVEEDAEALFEPPPGINRRTNLSRILDLMRECLFYRDGSINEARKIVNKLWKTKENPTILDFLAELERIDRKPGSRRSQYIETLLNRTTGLVENLPCLLFEKGFPYDMLAGKSVIWLVGSLPADLRHFYVSLKLTKLGLLLERDDLPDRKRILVILEEAHSYVHPSFRERADLGPPAMENFARRVAKRGLELILLDQIPALLPLAIKGNTNNIFVLKTTDDLSVRSLQKRMGLNDAQTQAVPLLPPRRMLFQNGDYPQTVEIEVPEITISPISEKEAFEMTRHLLESLPRTPIGSADSGKEIPIAEEEKRRKSILFEDRHRNFLEHIKSRPFDSLQERAKALGQSVWTVSRTLKELESMQLASSFWVNVGRRGSMRRHCKINDRGCQFLRTDPETLRIPGKGSDEHKHLQNMICRKMADEGRAVKVEMDIGGGKLADVGELVNASEEERLDLTAKQGKDANDFKFRAYEIELDFDSHTMTNIKRDCGCGCYEVVVLAQNSALLDRIRARAHEELEPEDLGRVRFSLIKDILEDREDREGNEGKDVS